MTDPEITGLQARFWVGRSGEEAARNQLLATGRTKSEPREKQVKAGAECLEMLRLNAELAEPQCGHLRTFLLTNVDV